MFTVQAARAEELGPAIGGLTSRQADALVVAPIPCFSCTGGRSRKAP